MYVCGQDCQKSLWKSHKAFCKAVSKPKLARSDGSSPSPQNNTCLIIDGLGPCGPGWEVPLGVERYLLDLGVNVIVVDATKGKHIPCQVASLLRSTENKPTSLLIMGWGSGDIDNEWHETKEFTEAAKEWCNAGGNFMVQGERMRQCGNWPKWFDKKWKDSDYYRADHKCLALGPDATHWRRQWYQGAHGAVHSRYNVKACMIQDVDGDEILFGTTEDAVSYSLVPGFGGVKIGAGKVAIAHGRYGEGTVSFFGDVNFEDETLQIMAVIARGA